MKKIILIVIFAAVLCLCVSGINMGAGKSGGVARVPILLYHHIAQEGDGRYVISYSSFKAQIDAIHENGYNTISFQALNDFVDGKADLPDKPIIITFDDGYLSNYELAYPLLKEYNMKATIFIIGAFVGQTTYKDTGRQSIPFFTYEQAREMYDSGLIDIQSHTYDMHQDAVIEGENARVNADIMEGEDPAAYKKLFEEDLQKSASLIQENVGAYPLVFSFPSGEHSEISDGVVKSFGYKISVVVDSGNNIIRRGDGSCLYGLVRNDMTDNVSPETLLNMLEYMTLTH